MALSLEQAFHNVAVAAAEMKATKKEHDSLDASLQMIHDKLWPKEVKEVDSSVAAPASA